MSRSRAAFGLMLVTAVTVAVLWLMPYTPARRVRTTTAMQGELVRTTLMSGVVAYAHQQPLVCPRAARVERVCAQVGDTVRAGDVLLVLDTGAESAKLAALQQARYQLHTVSAFAAGEAALRLGSEQTAALLAQETELRQLIGASSIRADMDGVVEAVYAEPGDYVQAGELLGGVRDGCKCVLVSGRAADAYEPGTPAVLYQQGSAHVAATLRRYDAPNDAGIQALWLEPLRADALDGYAIGERMTAELWNETVPECVLVPLSAVSADGRVWYTEGERAYSAKVNCAKYSRDWAALDSGWLGRRVIVQPDEARLTEGCRVKEAKSK